MIILLWIRSCVHFLICTKSLNSTDDNHTYWNILWCFADRAYQYIYLNN